MAPSTTFGASVVSTDQHMGDGTLHRPMLALDSPDLTPVPSRNGELLPGSPYLDKPPPNSPFYQHPPASFERVSHSQATSKVNLSLLEKDLEHGGGTATPLSTFDENPFASKISVDQNKECQMWPSKQTLLLSQAAEKKQKRDRKGCVGCGVVRDRWAGWNKRQQLIAKLVLAGLIVGVIVAVAVGISVAVHGTVYSNSGSQSSVGHSDSQSQQ